ncbi:MAG: SIS domain-containing protein [bacterium]
MSDEYFKRRVAKQAPDYEEVYWGRVVDPDGKARDRREERDQHLSDIRQELAFLDGLPHGRILDVGCGLGFLLSALAPEWDKHGVEVSGFAAKHAREWAKVHTGTLADARYPDEHFDVVVMHHVIEHLEDPIGALLEAYRILRRGGVLLLGTPDFESACARRFGEKYRLLHDPTHVSLFSNESMHRCLRDHGFVIDRVEYPFFDTRHFSKENLMRLFDTASVSPPFPGNFMTFYCHRPQRGGFYESALELSRLAKRAAEELDRQVAQAGALVTKCLLAGGKVLACGNGGSAADAQHFVAELIGRMTAERRSLPGITLSSDPSVVTALGNDYGFDNVFARQVRGLGKPGDILIALSTSGRSPNILKAVQAARQAELNTVAVVGERGDPSLDECTVTVHVPSGNTQRVQELHMAILHAICEHVERAVVDQER